MSHLMDLMDIWLGISKPDLVVGDIAEPTCRIIVRKPIRRRKTKPIDPIFFELELNDPIPIKITIPFVNYYQFIKAERESEKPVSCTLEGIDWSRVNKKKEPLDTLNQLTGPRVRHTSHKILTAY